jgi:hypothetical protein
MAKVGAQIRLSLFAEFFHECSEVDCADASSHYLHCYTAVKNDFN